MEWDTLYIEKKEAVAFLTLDRSASLNAVNDQFTADLEAACQTLDADTDLQVVVLRVKAVPFVPVWTSRRLPCGPQRTLPLMQCGLPGNGH